MQPQFVQVVCDVHCKWDQESPRYRVYVNDELFAERTWIWRDIYLEELLQISAPVGTYKIKYELVEPELGDLKIKNIRVVQGPGRIHSKGLLEIHNENA